MLKSVFSRTALVAVAGLGLLLLLPQTSEAQRRGGSGWGGSGWGGSGWGMGIGRGGVYYGPSWGGYGGYGYGNSPFRYGYGSYLGYPGSSWYQPYGSGYFGSYSASPYAYGYSGYSPGYSGYSPGYYDYSYAAPQYSYGTPQYSYGGTTQAYQSFYPPSGGASDRGQGQGSPVRVRVRVPDPNAEVYFGGHKTQQTGTDREFVSPPLTPGQDYTYQVRARWTENGRMRDETKSVRVRGGQQATVDFTAAGGQDAEQLGAPRDREPAGGRPATPPGSDRPVDQNPDRPANPGTGARPGTEPPARIDNPNPRPGGTQTNPPPRRDDE